MSADLRKPYNEACEALGAFLNAVGSDNPGHDLVARLAITYYTPTGGTAACSRALSEHALRLLDVVFLEACGRARCDECGILSPADDPFEPGSGGGSWICPRCEP